MNALANIIDNRQAPIWIGLVAGLIGVGSALVATSDPSEQALLAARWTARTAAPVFLVVYLASTVARLSPSPITKAVMRRRRQWGLGFALAHTIHLAALLVNITAFRPRPLESLTAGAIAYAMIYIMALTSTNAAQRKMGKWWKRVHKLGIHYIWFIFTASYALRSISEEAHYHLEGRIMFPVMLAALGLRILVWWRGRIKRLG